MGRSSLTLLCLGILLVLGSLQEQISPAQDFPYSVPQAPEFDSEGNHIETGGADTYTPRKRSKRRLEPAAPDPEIDARGARPYVSDESQSETSPPQPSTPPAGYGPPPAQSSPGNHRQSPGRNSHIASVPVQQPPLTTQQRPDCSRYPMMIAQARSEPEMQMAARMYLTCLLKSGWNIEQARNHVITTIESTYRIAR